MEKVPFTWERAVMSIISKLQCIEQQGEDSRNRMFKLELEMEQQSDKLEQEMKRLLDEKRHQMEARIVSL